MRKKQTKPQQVKSKYRSSYSKEDLLKAYEAVKERKLPIRTAASMYGVPAQTLRDRFTGVVSHTQTDLGGTNPNALMSREEESVLVEHVEVMSQLGYGFTHIQLQHLAGELAHSLERRPSSRPLSNNWLYGFLQRWRDRLASLNPRSLEMSRAKASSPEVIDKYYQELESILEKYNLKDKPQFIYNLDETGLQPDHRPPNVIAPQGSAPQAIVSPRSTTVTMVGCANAAGNSLPPFFIFKGKRYMPELVKGASIGTKATMSESGWINGTIFQEYLSDHFLPFIRPETSDCRQPILLMYDGHKSHISPSLIQWAKNNNIILFVLPPHTSHLLQPLDVAIYAPFKSYYHSECSLFMRKNIGERITRYNMCQIACKAYLKAMTPSNIQSAFRKTGIHPFSKQVIAPAKLYPAEVFREKEPVKKVLALKAGKEEVKKFLDMKIENMSIKEKCECCKKSEQDKLKRPSPGGVAITEGVFEKSMEEYEDSKKQPIKKAKKDKFDKSKKIVKQPTYKKAITISPKPSTSGINVSISDDSEDDCATSDKEKCCVCGQYYPPAAKSCIDLYIVNWAQCDKCNHWVHLRFCHAKTVVRRHSEFLCCHCVN